MLPFAENNESNRCSWVIRSYREWHCPYNHSALWGQTDGMLLCHVKLAAVANTVLSCTRLSACSPTASWISSLVLFTQSFQLQHLLTAQHVVFIVHHQLHAGQRSKRIRPMPCCDGITSDGLNSISSSIVTTHMFGVTCRTAKVTVGKQKKYSNMVKGRNHDQAFDETLEFVLAAGQPTACSAICVFMLHKHACIHCSFQWKNIYFVVDTSILQRHSNNRNTWRQQRHCSTFGRYLCYTTMRASIAHSAKCICLVLGSSS